MGRNINAIIRQNHELLEQYRLLIEENTKLYSKFQQLLMENRKKSFETFKALKNFEHVFEKQLKMQDQYSFVPADRVSGFR